MLPISRVDPHGNNPAFVTRQRFETQLSLRVAKKTNVSNFLLGFRAKIKNVARLFVCILLLAFALRVASFADVNAPNSIKAVLVTGASTGIGRKITERLASDGYFVYATARKDNDLKDLASLKNVHPLRLDVTNDADIAAALEIVSHDGYGLFGLVNNAGVASVGTLEDMNLDEFDLMMKVNAYGPVKMTKAFEPLIIEKKGRIVNISSISGILSPKRMPGYSMSKHAVEAFSDSLSDQLAALGVHVSVIEPGNYESNIIKNALARNRMDAETVKSLQAAEANAKDKQPDDVAIAVENALIDPAPKRRYMIVPEKGQAEITIRKQIEQLTQLNEDQQFTYDRATLIKMLDEALAKTRAHK